MEINAAKLSIKADREGIVIYVPEDMSVDDICCRLYRKFSENSRAFQKSGDVNVTFKGRELTRVQTEKIIEHLNNIDLLHVSFRCGDRTKSVPRALPPAVPAVSYGHQEIISGAVERPYIFRGDIQRKQTLEVKGNAIILGNVAKDAVVVSGRSIIVIGRLAGTAIAGKITGADAFIAATDMHPCMLRIGRAGCTCPDIRGDFAPMSAIATNDNNTISITYI